MALAYYLIRIFASLLALLPFPVLYVKSDVLAFFLYRVAGYRKKVVEKNLRNAFPDKDAKQRKKIASRFYRNLADVILESIKVEGMSLASLQKRYVIANEALLERFAREGRGVMLLMGHCGNWEWTVSGVAPRLKQPARFVAKRLSDPRFNDYVESLRCRFFPGYTIPHKMTMRYILQMQGKAFLVCMIGDQTPLKEESRFWTTFLNQETLFYEGAGKISHRMGMAVVYLELYRKKRGHYEGRLSLIAENAAHHTPEDILLSYVDKLEASITAGPDNWLWSHRRWKHKRTSDPLLPRHKD